MNNKDRIVFLLIVGFGFTFLTKTYSQVDIIDIIEVSWDDSSKARANEKEIGLGWAMNTRYQYSVINFKYYTRRNIWNDKIRLRFDFEGYRITKYIVPEYDRLLIQADYRVNLNNNNNYTHYLLPKAGFALTVDFYDEPSPSKWFGLAPNLGLDYEGRVGKLQLQAKNTITFFTDGLWYELNPGVSYKIYKNIYLKTSMNIIMAYTYNGNTAMGLYPGVSINVFPN